MGLGPEDEQPVAEEVELAIGKGKPPMVGCCMKKGTDAAIPSCAPVGGLCTCVRADADIGGVTGPILAKSPRGISALTQGPGCAMDPESPGG